MDSPLQWRHWFLSFQNKNNRIRGAADAPRDERHHCIRIEISDH
jgi:hypothetical protein